MMKIAVVLSLCLSFCQGWSTNNGPSLPDVKKTLQRAAATVSIAAVVAASPLSAQAADNDGSSIFSGSYSDPKHVNCKREILVTGPSAARISGTDGTPGCPADGSGKAWTLSGTVNGQTILVDFSPKGGPANLKGVYDDTESPAGIKWPDGNKWSKLSAAS